MKFMNEYEIDRAVQRHALHPVLGPATRFLHDFMEEVNLHSDGWPYWSPPVRAAKQLMELIESGNGADSDLKKAMTPIKSFMTRRGYKAGMKMPTITRLEANGDTKCGKCRQNPGQELHPCPFAADVHNNSETLCKCCPACEHDCLIDI